MSNKTEEVPDINATAVALSLDHELPGPNWEKVREHLKAQGATAETMLEVDELKELWESPEQPHLAVVNVRDARTLVISGWLGEKSRYDRTIVAKHKRSGALEAGGFDGDDASGTRKREFAVWFTPLEMRNWVDDSPVFENDEIDEDSLEEAIRTLVQHDDGEWTFEHSCQVRDRICELAINMSRDSAEPKEAANHGR